MATGFTTLPYGKTVYYGDDGSMRHGEQRIEGGWYYFDPETGQLLTNYQK